MSTLVSLGISLETECACASTQASVVGDAMRLYQQMASGKYDLMSVMPCPLTIRQWRDEHRTARKRADRAEKRGYFTATMRRERHADEIHEINTSADYRQGRPMTAGYQERQNFAPLPHYPCPRHAVRTTGVFDSEGTAVGYLVMIRAGELALVSQILGHADHLENEIMYTLFEYALEREVEADPECLVVYNRHDSGTDGLRFFKERLGFQEMPVEWLP